MKLKDLFMSYLNMNDSERILCINELQARRIAPIKIKNLGKKKVDLLPEEQILLDKILRSIK